MMKQYLRFSIVTIFFMVCVAYVIMLSNPAEAKEFSENGVLLTPENAPQLTDLFENMDKGPHQKFVSAESCLQCHQKKQTKEGVGDIPKIPHSYKSNCLECHTLPE